MEPLKITPNYLPLLISVSPFRRGSLQDKGLGMLLDTN